MTPTFILITKYGGQEFIDHYRSERELFSAASCFEPEEIDFAADIQDGGKWKPLTQDCIDEAVRSRREAAALRHHENLYARAS